MVFSNLFFLICFLPIFLIFYQIAAVISGRNIGVENFVLVIFSLAFYTFGGVSGLCVLLIVSLIGWGSGWIIVINDKKKNAAKACLIITVIFLVGVLAFFKYAGFFTNIVMPIGLSFYIFQLISYVADVYTGKCELETNFRDFLLYTACFHHVLQGPIIRYGDVRDNIIDRRYSASTLAAGIYRFSLGLAKKVILADHAGALANNLFPNTKDIASIPTLGIWLGSVCFSLQMYLDFSAYTDMAIGLGQMVGFKYPENFDYPYISKSVKEFWRRWHISLSFFFRDYVYIPLGGNRKGSGRKVFNLLVVWLLTGIWHGATLNFVIWGLYYFVFLVIENILAGKGKLPSFIQHLYVIFVFNLGWLIFRFDNIEHLKTAFLAFFGVTDNGFSTQTVSVAFQNNIFFFIVAVLACTPIFKKLMHAMEHRVKVKELPAGIIFGGKTVIAVVALILGIIIMAGSSYQPFLYNQF